MHKGFIGGQPDIHGQWIEAGGLSHYVRVRDWREDGQLLANQVASCCCCDLACFCQSGFGGHFDVWRVAAVGRGQVPEAVTFQSLEVCECDHALSIPLGLAPRKGLGAGAMRLGHGSYVFFSLLHPLFFC